MAKKNTKIKETGDRYWAIDRMLEGATVAPVGYADLTYMWVKLGDKQNVSLLKTCNTWTFANLDVVGTGTFTEALNALRDGTATLIRQPAFGRGLHIRMDSHGMFYFVNNEKLSGFEPPTHIPISIMNSSNWIMEKPRSK